MMTKADPATVRPLTQGERTLAASVFGEAIDLERVTVRRAKWWAW
jgi:hypothetical protein